MYNIPLYLRKKGHVSLLGHNETSAYQSLKLYYKTTLELTKSLIIKDDAIGEFMRDLDVGLGLSDNTNVRTEWRYYKYLNGEYLSNDNMMTIISIDTFTRIDLTKDNLAIHKATQHSLKHDSEFLDKLLKRYPGNEILIMGIVDPIDPEYAISVENGTILSYDELLVEEQEINLMSDLSMFIKNYRVRWSNMSYTMHNEYFLPAYQALLSTAVYRELLALRFTYATGGQAHSFHAKHYLMSHGLIDEYIDYLTIEQRTFLLNNLKYIKKHPGTIKTLEMMITNLMDTGGIPLDSFVTEITQGRDVVMTREQLSKYTGLGRDVVSLKDYKYMEGSEGVRYEEQLDKSLYSKHNRGKTKLLVSDTTSYEDSEPYTIVDALYNHWGYLANGDITSYVSVRGINTTKELTMSSSTAFQYSIVLMYKALGLKLDVLPTTVILNQVQVKESVSKADFPSTSLTQEDFDYINSLLVPLFTFTSTRLFNEVITEVQLNYNVLQRFKSNDSNPIRSVDIDKVLSTIYTEVKVPLEHGGMNVDSWLTDMGLELTTDIPTEEYRDAFVNLVNSAVGLDNRTRVNLKEVQKAIISVMERLTSFSVTYSSNINELPLIRMNYGSTKIVGTLPLPSSNYIPTDAVPERTLEYIIENSDYIHLGAVDWEDLPQSDIDSIKTIYIQET